MEKMAKSGRFLGMPAVKLYYYRRMASPVNNRSPRKLPFG